MAWFMPGSKWFMAKSRHEVLLVVLLLLLLVVVVVVVEERLVVRIRLTVTTDL